LSESILKMICWNFLFSLQNYTTVSKFITRFVGLEPAKPPLPLHYTITCVHTQFLFSSYILAEYKLLFKALSDIKWKSCKLESFITFRDTQLSCLQFLHLRSFTKFFKKTTVVTHSGCMGCCLLPSVGHGGWPYRRGQRRLDSNRRGPRRPPCVWLSKLINIEKVIEFCKMNK
jgi:hypothetical protein